MKIRGNEVTINWWGWDSWMWGMHRTYYASWFDFGPFDIDVRKPV